MATAPPYALRIAAAVLAILGLSLVVKTLLEGAESPEWTASFTQWAITGPLFALMACSAGAYALGGRADILLRRGRQALLAPSPRAFCIVVGATVVALASLFAWYCFDAQPVISDELSQRFQAHLLLSGHLSAITPQHPEFFDNFQTVNVGGRWFSEFPIGGPLLLAAGAGVGMVWLVNPLLAGWTAFNLYRFVVPTWGEMTARVTAVLFALSPFVLIMSGSEMNHSGTLAFVMLSLAALPEWVTTTDRARLRHTALQIGFGIAAAATLRPYDAILAALVIGGFQVILARRDGPRLRSFAWQLVGGGAPLTVLLVANWATTGNPFHFGYDVLNGPAHQPGFHVDPAGHPFTVSMGVLRPFTDFTRLSESLFEWPIPAVPVIALTLALTRRGTRWDYLLLALIGALTLGYAAYWAPGDHLGPRFLFTAIPAFLIFTALMPGVVADRLHSPVARRTVLLLLPFCLVAAWEPIHLPLRLAGVWSRASEYRSVTEYQWRGDVATELAAAKLTNALVFVHEPWHERLAARLRALGMPALLAETMAGQVDACTLQQALDAEDSLPEEPPLARLRRAMGRAIAAGPAQPMTDLSWSTGNYSLIGGRPATQACARQIESDNHGIGGLEQFLPYDAFDREGRLGGDTSGVVFARDMGGRNEVLRPTLGSRRWYRYRPPTGPHDVGPVFVPYNAPTF